MDSLEKQLTQWHENDEFQKIVDAIEALPPGERTYPLLGRLASALNNLERYDDALEVLDGVREQGESDPLWHYRRGYALYYQDKFAQAKAAFGRAAELDPTDEDVRQFLEWCDGEPESSAPELYTAEELDAVEAFISGQFGECDQVYHELVSPDIHVDLCIIPPTPARDYYTLVTMGMGAHRMNVPEELAEQKLSRAEVLVCLPPDWKLADPDERWYWPLRWLKILARLPIRQDTWLGWGHTVPAGEPFAENTKLSGVMLVNPGAFGEQAGVCVLPDGDEINFYQMLPLYAEEMEYKLQNGAEALLDRLGDAPVEVVDPRRSNVCRFREVGRRASVLTGWEGPELCLASNRILLDSCRVGYLYREEAESGEDSGWRFTSGDEPEGYLGDPKNFGVSTLTEVCGLDPDILPCLRAPVGAAFLRDGNGGFRRIGGEEATFRERADSFWEWFCENEPKLSDMVEHPNEYQAEEIVAFISEGTGLISADLHFNVGGDHEFTFAVEGAEHLYFLLPWLTARLPERYREKWRFFPWIPGARGADFSFGMYGVNVRAGDVLTGLRYHPEENLFSLRFYEKALCGLEEGQGLNAFCLMMENCIGEGLSRLYVGDVSRAAGPEEGMFPLTGLGERIGEALAAAGQEVLAGPDQCYTAYEREPDGGGELRCDVVAGMSCCMDLVNDYDSDEPQMEELLGELGAKAVFLSFPVEEMTPALQLRHELEDRLEAEVLGPRGSGTECGILLGGAMGERRAYIDLLLYDEPAFWERVGGLLSQYPQRFTLSAFHRGATPILIH